MRETASPAPRPERRRDPSGSSACHDPGRRFPSDPIVLDMLSALGIDVCPQCHQATRIRGRDRNVERDQ